VAGGPEKRLTADANRDDGPEFTTDGKWVYFNSNRTGQQSIWRMPADGAEKVTPVRC
jgi:Tol biopolymer transport system component